MGGQRHADLGQVQRAGAGVEERDGDEHAVAADAVRDGEVERPLDRPALLDPVGGEGVGGGAHDLEEHDEVEQVPGQREPDHAGHEQQHQPVEQALDGVEVAQGVEQRGADEQTGERGHPGPAGIDGERNPDRHPMAGRPSPHPVRPRLRGRMLGQDHAQRRGGQRGQGGGGVAKPARRHGADGDEQRPGEQRHEDRQRGQVPHQCSSDRRSCRVEAAEALVRLHDEREQERGDRRLDHDVGEHEHLDDRVDQLRGGRDVGHDRSRPAVSVADRQQQDVGGGLDDGQAQHRAHEVAARHHPPQADDEQPYRDRVREDPHCDAPSGALPGSISDWSRNSVQVSRNAPVTSSPTAAELSGMIPDDSKWPGMPTGRKSLR